MLLVPAGMSTLIRLRRLSLAFNRLKVCTTVHTHTQTHTRISPSHTHIPPSHTHTLSYYTCKWRQIGLPSIVLEVLSRELCQLPLEHLDIMGNPFEDIRLMQLYHRTRSGAPFLFFSMLCLLVVHTCGM